MTTVGRWSPNKVRARVLDGTWVSPAEELGGMVLLTPTSIAYSGTSASIGANGSVEFSAVTSLSFNGVFDATYDNYMIVVRILGSTTGISIRGRYRSAGTDATGADYAWQYLYVTGTSVTGLRTTGETFARMGTAYSTQRSGFTVSIYGPYLSQPTAARVVSIYSESGAAMVDEASTHSLSTSYDGLTLFTSGGNVDGLVSVYGLVGA